MALYLHFVIRIRKQAQMDGGYSSIQSYTDKINVSQFDFAPAAEACVSMCFSSIDSINSLTFTEGWSEEVCMNAYMNLRCLQKFSLTPVVQPFRYKCLYYYIHTFVVPIRRVVFQSQRVLSAPARIIIPQQRRPCRRILSVLERGSAPRCAYVFSQNRA